MSKYTNRIQNYGESIGDIVSLSNESINEWWWHLGQVADGGITFNLIPEMKPDMGI